jgi:activator of HSP90 ATPase
MDIMGQHFQSVDSIVALTVTAGFLLFGSLYYYSSINREKKKSVRSKKSISVGPIKKPSTSTPISGSKNQSVAKTTSSPALAQDSGSSEMKGYKMTSDGRKTTYFNREISEEEKTLLGDFTPKPLASNAELSTNGIGAQSSSAKSASSSGSAWNTAGTWEEKNQSPWAAKRIQELLKLASLSLTVDGKDFGSVSCTKLNEFDSVTTSGPSMRSRDTIMYSIISKIANFVHQVSVSKINSVEGDALITMTRGKKKFIYDYTISLDWKLEIGDSG